MWRLCDFYRAFFIHSSVAIISRKVIIIYLMFSFEEGGENVPKVRYKKENLWAKKKSFGNFIFFCFFFWKNKNKNENQSCWQFVAFREQNELNDEHEHFCCCSHILWLLLLLLLTTLIYKNYFKRGKSNNENSIADIRE